jgi:hypothetical protein
MVSSEAQPDERVLRANEKTAAKSSDQHSNLNLIDLAKSDGGGHDGLGITQAQFISNAFTPATGNGDRPDGVQYLGRLTAAGAIGGTGLYANYAHPYVQRALIDGQLKDDAAGASASDGLLKKTFTVPRKAYLENFSSVYQAQSQLAPIEMEQTSARQAVGDLAKKAAEDVEALGMNKKEVAALRALAGSTPSATATPAQLEAIAKAGRQVATINSVGTSVLKRSAALAEATQQLDFFRARPDYLPSSTKSGYLDWTALGKDMTDSKLFTGGATKPLVDKVSSLATTEAPIYKVGAQMVSRRELEAVAQAAETKTSEVWKAKGLKSLGLNLAIVAGEATAQGYVAEELHQNGHEGLGRLIQPNLPGTIAKAGALMLTPGIKGKFGTYAAAQLFEVESNMDHITRAETSAGVLAGALAAKYGGKWLEATGPKFAGLAEAGAKFSKAAIVADVALTAGAEIFADLTQDNDNTLSNFGAAVAKTQDNPRQIDFSYFRLRDNWQGLAAEGIKDPFLMTQKYDEDTRGLQPKNGEPAMVFAYKLKQLMTTEQAQGETIIANGMSSSQFLKLQNPDKPLLDNHKHQEDWRIGAGTDLDIASRGSKPLIEALDHADRAEGVLNAMGKSNDAAGVEQNRQDIKNRLDSLFNDSHAQQIVDVLQRTSWLPDWFKNWNGGASTYNLTQFHDAYASDYSHLYDAVVQNAKTNEALLPKMQAAVSSEQERLDDFNKKGNKPMVAMEEKFVQARQDMLHYSTERTAKVYRDAALLKLGFVQSNLDSGSTDAKGLQDSLALVSYALSKSAAIDDNPQNPDWIQLKAIYDSIRARVGGSGT